MGLGFTVSSVNQALSSAVAVWPRGWRITMPALKSSKQRPLRVASLLAIGTSFQHHTRHAQIGGVDHFSVEGGGAASFRGRLLVGAHHLFGRFDLFGGGTENGVH